MRTRPGGGLEDEGDGMAASWQSFPSCSIPATSREVGGTSFFMSGLLCIGHRGACGHEPENTLRSVRRALELGAQGIEIDVHFVDGELVVIHDAKLDRTMNGKGYLARKSFAYLRSLDAG